MPETLPITVVTGGTGGIGLHTAIALAALGGRVVVTGRNAARGADAVARIQSESGNGRVEFVAADLSTLAGVEALVADLAHLPAIDVLINNAGRLAEHRMVNDDGFESNFAVNVVAPYRLTLGLRVKLEAAPSARVVMLTGGAPFGGLDVDNLDASKGFVPLPSYSHSKRAMEAMAVSLSRTLESSGIVVHIAMPGPAATSMTHAMTWRALPWYARPLWPLFRLMMPRNDGGRSAAKASQSSIFAATAPELADRTGLAFGADTAPMTLHPSVLQPSNQAAVLAAIENSP